ncbi:zinc finger protein 845-like isoform X2 [Pectinophora gossypiella]|uniref:zinc finger protein 845-like isoform X2 n=1 Tax=Pectinophora gossypiella TaxID=13191 RepID=UPI00214E1E28|nr:zinc finger protein 845-like isoform X2 [Pectinophora gossypiella]
MNYIFSFLQCTYDIFFNEISDIRLCVWCDVGINKASHLIKTAEESKTILENYKKKSYKNQNKFRSTGIFNLKYTHNKHIDIPPVKNDETFHEESITIINKEENFVSEESLKNGVEGIKNEADVFDDEDITISCLEDDISEENNREEKATKVHEEKNISEERSKNKKQIDYKEMNFDVKYLNHEEQLNEIEMKKQTERFMNMKFKCEKCGIGYMFEDVFNEHMNRHSQVTPHRCQICALYFKSKEVLSQHRLAHRRWFVCLLCGAKFTRWRLCVLHRNNCDYVQHISINFSDMSRILHKGLHKEKKYACNNCDRRFATKHRLTVHIRTHSSLRMYVCTICARAFSTQYNLRAHTRTHSHNIPTYYCVECDKRYKSQKGLDRHYRESRRHLTDEELRFTCPECFKRFTKESLLNSHVNTRHLTTHRCDVCDKTFSSNTNLRKHVRCVHAKEKTE